MGSSCSIGRSTFSRMNIVRKFKNLEPIDVNKFTEQEYKENRSTFEGGSHETTPNPMSPDSCGNDTEEALSTNSVLRMNSSYMGREASATSTVLPGTSINLSHTLDELPEFDLKPLPDLNSVYQRDVRNLLMGRLSEDVPSPPLREVFLYVVANLQDTIHEQIVLEERVFPDMRRHCADKGYVLNIIDFHRVVPGDQLRDHSFRDLCIDNLRSLIESNRLIILVLLGSSFELPPPPNQISERDFDVAISNMRSADDREMFHRWYSVDENSIPTTYILKPVDPDYSGKENSPSTWSSEGRRMVSVLSETLSEKAREKYLKSVFEEELELCIHANHRAPDRCLMAELSTYLNSETKTPQDYVKRIHQLRSELRLLVPESNRLKFDRKSSELIGDGENNNSMHPRDFVEFVALKLETLLDNIFQEDVEWKRKEPLLGINEHLYEELISQHHIIRSHLHHSDDISEILAAVRDYLLGPLRHPLVVHGAQGRGKTALLATATVLCSQWIPEAGVVVRLAALTPESSTQEKILRSICEQWCHLYGEHPSLASKSIMEHSVFFDMMLQRVCSERPIVILLDGLDQVEVYSCRSMKWLPTLLPDQVKFILSVRDGSREMAELKEMFPEESSVFLEMPKLYLRNRLLIVGNLLQSRSRRLTDSQWNFVKFCVSNSSDPSYCHLLGELACQWHSGDKNLDAASANHTVSGLIRKALRELEQRLGEKKHIGKLVLGLLLSVKTGILDSEVIDILVSHEFTNRREAVDDEKVAKNIWPFGLPLKPRYLEELTYLCICKNLPVRKRFLMSMKWLSWRVTSGDPYQFLEDIKLYRQKNPDDREFDLVREVIQLSSYALSYDGIQFFSQLYGRLRTFFSLPDNCSRYPSVYSMYRESCASPRPSFLSIGPSCLRELVYPNREYKIPKPDPTSISEVLWLPRGNALLSLNVERNELVSWDSTTLSELRIISDIPQVRFVGVIDDRRIIVLCENHLRLYDLRKGELLFKMANVDSDNRFNILRNKNLVMVLSSEGSEILLLNTNNGRVENRFHAGDDRYLVSLLVSSDGGICVCGDALQKPFPLLLWDVTNGKLIREFRISHHEYITRLIDMTENGRFLVVAAKELLDTTPNFLVTYDTTCGRLLWSWKTVFDSTAVKISSKNFCVVSATANAAIYVWDLKSGQARFTMWGHSSPVDNIDVIKSGSQCLTYDSTSVDRSIRIWDLHVGSCIAVFTPDQNLMCCSVSENGDMVALGLSGRTTPTVLALCHNRSVPSEQNFNKDDWTPKHSEIYFETAEITSISNDMFQDED